MTIESRFQHTLVVKRNAPTGTRDDYGQPLMAESTFATVPGLIQPRSAREIALASQAGAVIGRFVGYISPLAGLSTHDWIILSSPESMAGRYDILDIDDAAGLGHHYELSLQQVV